MSLIENIIEQKILKITKKFKSPNRETSIVKGVPMAVEPLFKKYLKGKGFWIRYRGPSIPGVYDRPASHCNKEYATTFAVYKR